MHVHVINLDYEIRIVVGTDVHFDKAISHAISFITMALASCAGGNPRVGNVVTCCLEGTRRLNERGKSYAAKSVLSMVKSA